MYHTMQSGLPNSGCLHTGEAVLPGAAQFMSLSILTRYCRIPGEPMVFILYRDPREDGF